MSKLYSFHLTRLWLGVALLGLFNSPSTVLFAQSATQITNTAGNPPPAMSDPADFKAFNGRLYFSAKSGPLNYRQLFSTDGTAAGTRLERRSSATPLEGVDPKNLTVFRGRLYFSAQTSNSERELWVTDGTPEGTVLFKEIQPSNGSGNPIQITATDDKLYFTAVNNLAQELWVSDGTPAGTRRLADVVGVPVGSTDPTELTAVGNKLFYKANVIDNMLPFSGLWVTDGTAGGTRLVKGGPIAPGAPFPVFSNTPRNFSNLNNQKLIFRAAADGTEDEPWISDGTLAGTFSPDIVPSGNGSFPNIIPGSPTFNGRFYFEVQAGNNRGLYATDGNVGGTQYVKSGLSLIKNYTLFNGKLYFTVSDTQIWETDGTETGTRLVKQLSSGGTPPTPKNLVVAGGKLYFTTVSTNGGAGEKLWVSDGTDAGTRVVFESAMPLSDRIKLLIAFDDQLYLTAFPATSSTIPELFRLNANQPPVAPAIANAVGTVGQGFSQVIPPFTDPDGGILRYAVTGLPANLSFSGGSGGIIGGTPVVAGVFLVTVSATDLGGLMTSVTYTITINPANGNPPNGSPLQLLVPTYNCVTGAITFNTQGGDGSPISYSAPGISRASVTANYGIVEVGLRNDPKPILLQATQNGSTASYTFDLPNACGGGSTPEPPSSESLQLLPPTYDCVTGVIRFNSRGGDGSLITYSAPGVSRGAATDAIGVVELELRKDPKPIVLQAHQNDVTVSFTFDLPNACGGQARKAVSDEPGTELVVNVFGNPVAGDVAQLEVRGAEGLPLTLTVNDLQGRPISNQLIKRAAAVEIQTVRLGQPIGTYLLRIATPSQNQTIRLLRK